MDIQDYVNPKVAIFAGVILACVGGFKSLVQDLAETHWGQRLLPLLPLLIGLLGGLAGAVDGALITRIQGGLTAGMVAAVAYKTGKTTIGGVGVPPKA